ncbi:MAG: hypothetical protein AB7O24_13350 [Kofleriaceae bacterium]
MTTKRKPQSTKRKRAQETTANAAPAQPRRLREPQMPKAGSRPEDWQRWATKHLAWRAAVERQVVKPTADEIRRIVVQDQFREIHERAEHVRRNYVLCKLGIR